LHNREALSPQVVLTWILKMKHRNQTEAKILEELLRANHQTSLVSVRWHG